jgi:hypothetical protein
MKHTCISIENMLTGKGFDESDEYFRLFYFRRTDIFINDENFGIAPWSYFNMFANERTNATQNQ